MADVIAFPIRPKGISQDDSLAVLHWSHARMHHVLESYFTELISPDQALNQIMTILEDPEVLLAAGIEPAPRRG